MHRPARPSSDGQPRNSATRSRRPPVEWPRASFRNRERRPPGCWTSVAPDAGGEPTEARGADAPAEIRENIEQTRVELDGTLGELQERLSPSHVKEQVRESVKETIEETKTALRAATVGRVETMIRDTGSTLNEAQQSIWTTILENPVPAAVSAIGLTWLFLNRGGKRDGGRRRLT